MDAMNIAEFPLPATQSQEEQDRNAQRLKLKESRRKRHINVLRRQEREQLRATKALEGRLAVLDTEKYRVSRRVETIDMERCELAERRARLLTTLSAQEKKLRQLEESSRRTPVRKMIRWGITSALVTNALISIGGQILKRIV